MSANMICWGSQTAANISSTVSVVISIITLFFLIKYVRATDTIAKQSIAQVEAGFRPAIIAKPGPSLSEPPILLNIGTGPAVELVWRIPNSQYHGRISYLEVREEYHLPVADMKPIYNAGMRDKEPEIKCVYQSISNTCYTSTSIFDLNADRFTTTFGN